MGLLFVTSKLGLLDLFLLKTEIKGHHAHLIENEIEFVHLLDTVNEIIDACEVLPHLNGLGRLLLLLRLSCLIFLLLFISLLLLLLGGLLGLAGVNALESRLLLLFLLHFLQGSRSLLFLGLLGHAIGWLHLELDITEADEDGTNVLNDAGFETDTLLLEEFAEFLDVYALLVALLTIFINEDALNGGQVISQVHSETGSGLTVASDESLESLKERSQVEMSGFLVGFLLLVETALLLKLCNGSVDFLGLLFGGQSALLGCGGTVIAVLTPVSEVPSTCHVVLGEPEDF